VGRQSKGKKRKKKVEVQRSEIQAKDKEKKRGLGGSNGARLDVRFHVMSLAC